VTIEAALVGAGGVVVGTILSALLGIWAENRRSDHEMALRKLELREAHRSRLHSERRAAYTAFYRAFRRVDQAMADVIGVHPEDADSETSRDALGELNAALQREGKQLGEALTDVELVASSSVADAAVTMREHVLSVDPLADESFEERFKGAIRRARDMLATEQTLRMAIREELELDR
jgi:hypothetical protein